LFFVLSGFLIAHHLTQHWPQQMNADFFLRYWLKRVLRTFPAYFAMLLLVAFGLLPFYQTEVAEFGEALAAHAIFMQDYYGAVFVPAFWSLGVEEKFYLLSPFVLLWLRRVGLAAQIRLLIALALTPVVLRLAIVVTRAEDLTTYPQFFWAARAPFHLAMDGLWIGAMCALLYGRLKTAGGAPAALKALFYVGVTLLALALPLPWFDGVHMTVSALLLLVFPVAFACILLAATLSETPVNACLRSRWLRFWAVISYSVYLTHMTIVPPALHVTKLATSGREMAPLAEFLVFLGPFVVFACASGLLLHFVVEKPFLLLKDRVRL
jgi:peptidoglycan/LPS O-acetylase OafA/YrhL